ncbi:MAG: hybrid sensor histidine kinase/response regulator [Thermodesulfobacteriota bacterium]
MRTYFRSLLAGKSLAMVLSTLTLAAFIALLVGKTYQSQVALQKSVLQTFRQDLEKQAAIISYFYSQRKNDLNNLPAKRELSTYFENKALGMSMEYGLKASLVAIQESFDLVLEERMLDQDNIYTRFVFIDHAGNCLIDTGKDSASIPKDTNCRRFLAPQKLTPTLVVEPQAESAEIIVSAPFFFKGVYAGQIVAWVSAATVLRHFIPDNNKVARKFLGVLIEEADLYFPGRGNASFIPSIPPGIAAGGGSEWGIFTTEDEAGAEVEMLATRVGIQGTPLFLLSVIPSKALFGYMSPWHLLAILGSLSVLSLLGVGFVWWANTRNLILQARLEEADIREKEIAAKNLELEAEINERCLAEAALRESEWKYRFLVSNMPAVAFKGSRDGGIEFFDDKIEALSGYGKDTFNSGKMKWSEVILEEDLPVTEKAFTQALETNKTYITEYRIKKKGGEIIWIQARGQIICDLEDRIESISGVFFDITERKKIEAEYFMLSKIESLGLMAGGIAHDFNNILTGILGNISLAMVDCQEQDHRRESLILAEKACLRAKGLARQLLTFAKGGVPVKERFSALEAIAESAELTCKGSQIRCEFHYPQDLWALEADPGQIRQVIQNLIINACQAMPAGGTINVYLDNLNLKTDSNIPVKPGKYLRISIKDHGIGIPPEYIQRIFDPYFTTKQTGSGLGLATSYSIIKNHGGHVAVKSRLGEGTTFTIYLPASDQGITIKTEEDRELITGEGAILVMDDEPMVREVLGKMLTSLGYEAIFAQDGAEAIEIFTELHHQRKKLAAVILDLTVPGAMGGKETIKRLLEIDPQVKALVSSGYSEDPIMSNFPQYGFSGVMLKPYRVSELSKILSELIVNEK